MNPFKVGDAVLYGSERGFVIEVLQYQCRVKWSNRVTVMMAKSLKRADRRQVDEPGDPAAAR